MAGCWVLDGVVWDAWLSGRDAQGGHRQMLRQIKKRGKQEDQPNRENDSLELLYTGIQQA